MRLAISNIAWDVSEDLLVAKLLQKYGVDAIDVAPGKYFPDPARATSQEIAKIRLWWADKGIDITGMQALLFGTVGLNMFGDEKSQEMMLEHLRSVCGIAAGLGATKLVFGSPKNRDRSGLGDVEALEKSVVFFRRLGNIAYEHGVVICLEPNPTHYGANFMTTSSATAQVVAATDLSSIRMQFDTGALTINDESPEIVIDKFSKYIAHIHASEPDLVPLGDCATNHQLVADLLLKSIPNHVVTIEMLATNSEPHLQSIERAIRCASKYYTVLGGAEE